MRQWRPAISRLVFTGPPFVRWLAGSWQSAATVSRLVFTSPPSVRWLTSSWQSSRQFQGWSSQAHLPGGWLTCANGGRQLQGWSSQAHLSCEWLTGANGGRRKDIRKADLQDLSSIGLSGTGLAFIAFPNAISRMPFPFVWAFLFFMMLFCLGIDYEFAMIESVMTVLRDSGLVTNISKEKLAGIVFGIYRFQQVKTSFLASRVCPAKHRGVGMPLELSAACPGSLASSSS